MTVYTIVWTLGIFFFFLFSFLFTNTFFFSGFIIDLLMKEHWGPKEKAEKIRGGQGLETHLCLEPPGFGPRYNFYENFYYLLIISFFFGLNNYKGCQCCWEP